RRREFPFLSVHAGPRTEFSDRGSVRTLELHRGPLSFAVEQDLDVDPFLMRYRSRVKQELVQFKPDLLHITGPNDIGLLGALLAKQLRIPMTASWHTNVHEFAAWRLERRLSLLPKSWSKAAAGAVEESLLAIFTKLYGAARTCFAPNPELIQMLEERTGKPTYVMRRGVEIETFNPSNRDRSDDVFELGYVGRISAEKNVRFLKTLEDGLFAAGLTNFRIVVAGHGNDQAWLETNLKTGVFPGVLSGAALSRAYANFDLFTFPSFTDTYGNVINEAMASGVPCIVTKGGGPKYLIEDGKTGIQARDEDHFIAATAAIVGDPQRHAEMRVAARRLAESNSWDLVFERLYEQYRGTADLHPIAAGA
ncbi:MAG: glycosyltransferase, partial [Acidobacteria bacterium]|nr:glycosyltransferase [Acidobacteriota bacterium]